MTGGYDSGYSSCSCFWGREPGSLVKRFEQVVGTLSGLEVLDSGCGEGKNAVYCALKGANVTAIDVSSYALANAESAWGQPANVRWLVDDIRQMTIPSSYDLVIAYGLLHCMSSTDEIARVVYKLQLATKAGGYHIVCAFNDRYQELDAHPGFQPCLAAHSFYVDLYKQWNMIEVSDTDLTEVHPHNNIKHTHSMTRFIAQK